MALKLYVCTNCGFWQRYFTVPPGCPVCNDFRHAPPADGWRFQTTKEVAALVKTRWREMGDGITMFTNDAPIGIGPSGYLLEHPAGNIAFEATNWYDEAALGFIEERGGVRFLAASHPHAYGACWQLQERFQPEVTAINVADLNFASAFKVNHPFDEQLELLPGCTLLRTGGHFAGHSVLYLAAQQTLFCGDALKFHLDEQPVGISCHKAFVGRVPMSHGEIRRYREVLAPLQFKQVFTSFEHCPDATTADALRLFDAQLAGRPFFGSMPLKETAQERAA